MRNSIGIVLALPIFALIMLISGCERSGSEASKGARVTSKVTNESRPNEDRDNFCKSKYEDYSKNFLQGLYRFEGNLPKIPDSKVKRLQFVDQERGDYEKNDKAYRDKLWSTEMYPDPDYWQWQLQVETKTLINNIEYTLDWPRDRDDLLGYLHATRSGKNYSDSEKYLAELQRRQGLSKISEKVNLLSKLASWSNTVKQTEDMLSRLGEGDRLNKSVGVSGKNDRMIKILELTYDAKDLSFIINCQIEFLGRF